MHWLDPDHLPETQGIADRFLLDPHGKADGLLLKSGQQVHFPPHMSAKAVAAIKLGSAVKIRGVRPRGADLVAAVSLEAADGTTIVDHGPPKPEGDHEADKLPPPDGRKPMDAEGVVRHVLHGPKGEARGALLEDGRIVRMPAHTAAALHPTLAPGQKLAARGDGTTNPLGTVIAAKEIGATLSTLHPVEPKKLEPAI